MTAQSPDRVADLEASITEDALHRIAGDSGRGGTVLTALVRHLHAFIREVEPSEDEWLAAIRFLTRAGQMSTQQRAEFILLSDVLGVSMLVDAINHRATSDATESTVLGPFYAGRQPVTPYGGSLAKRDEDGPPLVLSGRILGAGSRLPLRGAAIEIWQTAPNGRYDVQDSEQPPGHLRGTLLSEADGTYRCITAMPVSYAVPDDGAAGDLLRLMGRHPYRPAHVHFMISATGYRRLVTHLFVAGDPYLESDAVFGVKLGLVVQPDWNGGTASIAYDFILEPVLQPADRPE